MPSPRAHALILLAALLCAQAALAVPPPQPGPDVIVGDIPDSRGWGTYDNVIYGFDLGTTSCNKGNNNLRWVGTGPYHPVIAQNVYRYRLVNGASQFEQIGMSWVKHGFFATSQNLCGTCNNQAVGGNVLGVGCSDPYDQGLNGQQSGLGPRSEINPATGTYPWSQIHNWPAITPNARRIQINTADLSLVNPWTYFGEALYITPDDAAAGDSWNNVSWRKAILGTNTAGYAFGVTDSARQTQPALFAWQSMDSTVRLAAFDVPGEGPSGNGGRFWLAHAVTQTGATWHYEYCLENLTSDRAGASISIPIPPGAVITNAATRRTDSHSGEPYSNAPWTITTTATAVTFSCPETYAQNINASALRWGLTSTFRFDANVGPGASDGSVAVGTFKPGTPTSFVLSARTPGGASIAPPTPANDECSAPQPIHNGENRSSTLGATTSSPAPAGACTPITNDLWFTYTYHSYDAPSTCPGNITFDTCGSEFDTAMVVYPGSSCPAADSWLGCNNDAPAASCTTGAAGSSSISVNAVEGAAYLLRIGSPAGQRGNLVINVAPPYCIPPNGACCANNGTCQIVTGQSSCYSGTFLAGSASCSPNPCPQPPPPANDNCTGGGAIIIGDNALGYPAINGTNAGATITTSESCNSNISYYDVWYVYTPATTATVIVDTCTVPSSGVLMDTILIVHSGSCTGPVVDCNDDEITGSCGGASRISTTLTAGTAYYIRVAGYASSRGDFVLRITGGGGVTPPTTGARRWGSACIITATANCAGTNQAFAGTGVACNTMANHAAPCCQADYNHADGIAIQDIFDFLNLWFAASPASAFGGDGTRIPVVQDIFDFLNAWFAGC